MIPELGGYPEKGMATHSSILDGEMMLKAQPLCTGAEMKSWRQSLG